MSKRRNEKLAEKYREKQNWKAEVANLLEKRKEAEAKLKDASEIIAKVQKWTRDAIEAEEVNFKAIAALAKVVGVEVPKKEEPETEKAEA